jgi:hypothetical protein
MALSKKGVGKCHQHMGYLNVSKNIENWIVYYLLWYIGSEAARPTHGGFLEIGYLKIKWFIIILWKDMLFNGHAPLSDTPILFLGTSLPHCDHFRHARSSRCCVHSLQEDQPDDRRIFSELALQ